MPTGKRGPYKKRPQIERLLEKTRFIGAAPDDCWEFGGGTTIPNGKRGRYGRIDQEYAHRVMAAAVLGRPLMSGELVLHGCDNSICVNPRHLEIGDHAMNMQQMVERGRSKNCGFASRRPTQGGQRVSTP